jgi:hypothetical protein
MEIGRLEREKLAKIKERALVGLKSLTSQT